MRSKGSQLDTSGLLIREPLVALSRFENSPHPAKKFLTPPFPRLFAYKPISLLRESLKKNAEREQATLPEDINGFRIRSKTKTN
jgi:hypothetical protein